MKKIYTICEDYGVGFDSETKPIFLEAVCINFGFFTDEKEAQEFCDNKNVEFCANAVIDDEEVIEGVEIDKPYYVKEMKENLGLASQKEID